MATKFMDGMRVVTPDVPRDIEDAAYDDPGNPEGILECFSQEEYEAAMENFSAAQLLDLLNQCEGFPALMRLAESEASDKCAAQNAYFGVDQAKKNLLDQQRQLSVYVAKWIRDTVENAALVPRPVLAEQ